MRHRPVPLLARTLAIGAASAVMVVAGAAAHAESNPAEIDFDAKGTIVIHKHEHQLGDPEVVQPNGEESIDRPPVKDVTFSAYPITSLDLSDNDDWVEVNELSKNLGTACEVPAPHTTGDPIVGITDAEGVAELETKVGAYLVCETGTPPSVTDKAKPFIVTIPYPYQNQWLYRVHTYPKNATLTTSKETLPQEDLGLGATVSFAVKIKIPALEAGDTFESFTVTDEFDSRLAPLENPIGSVTVGGEPVTAGYSHKVDGQTVTLTFDGSGLQWLSTQGDKELIVTFKAVVKEIGEITNQAIVNVDDAELTTNPATTNWGDVKVLKHASASQDKGLSGAVFQVYAATEPYASDCSAAQPTGDPISVAEKTEFKSNENGSVFIEGLFVSSNNGKESDGLSRCYVLREIKAPSGYSLPANADFGVTVKAGATETFDIAIANQQQTGTQLPLTGSTAIVVLSVAGGLAILAALVIVASRRSRLR